MGKTTLDLDLVQSQFIITGDLSKILKSSAGKIFLKDILKPTLVEEDKIIIPFIEENKENLLSQIRKLLKRFGLEEDQTADLKEVMDRFLLEEKKFQEFSLKALKIRNNDCDLEDFRNFTSSLNHYLPNRKLYPLQLLSAYHLAFAQNACNFSVPGAGKTSIVYGAFSYLKSLPSNHHKFVDKIMIIGPLSSFGPWENEYFECFGEKPSVQRLIGNMSKEQKTHYLYSSNIKNITLLSYQSVPGIINDIEYFLKKNKVMLVLDEAHKVKNTSGAVTAEAVMRLSKYASSRVVLTGTPAPNGYEDLYNLFNFIWPQKNIIHFHLNQLRDMSNQIYDSRLDALIDNISPFFIRIKKSDLGIPAPIIHPPILVEMGSHQRKIYDFIEKKYMDFFMGKDDINTSIHSMLVKSRLIRLMQAATNPTLLQRALDDYFIEDGATNQTYIDDSEILKEISTYQNNEIPTKFIIAGNLIKEIINRGEKVIVWLTFIQNIKQFSSYLNSLGINNKLLYGEIPVNQEDDNGDTDIETRESIVKDFHNASSPFKVLIANPFAVAESISLHKVCHNAIYIERTFNAAQYIQSKDRIHRYGLKPTDKINYYFILSKDTIDETIDERLIMKENRMNEIMESQPIPLFSNIYENEGNEDIRKLIENYVKRTM